MKSRYKEIEIHKKWNKTLLVLVYNKIKKLKKIYK